MGTVCAKNEGDENQHGSNINKKNSSGSIKQSMCLHGVEFYLQNRLIGITDRIRQKKSLGFLKSDSCLLIFTEMHAKLQCHHILNKFDQNVGNKAQEFKDALLLKDPNQASGVMILPVAIKDFPFRDLCIVGVNVWSGAGQQIECSRQLQKTLAETFQKLSERRIKIKNLVISEMNDEFGIPHQTAARCMSQALAQYHDKFDSVSMICTNEDSLEMHEEFLNSAVVNSSQKADSRLKPEQRNSSVYF